jgi:ribosomal protein S18 acetylase RimI-like enzyme
MAPPISLRPVASSDHDFLLELYASTRADGLALVPWSNEQKRAFIEMQFSAQSRAYAAHERAIQSIVMMAETPVGRFYVDRRPDEIRIIDKSLLPEFRGRGIGTALLNHLLAEADANAQRVSIHVERSNPALRLYTRLGFQPAGDVGIYLYMERRPSTH